MARGRPRKVKDEDDMDPPFELEDDFVPSPSFLTERKRKINVDLVKSSNDESELPTYLQITESAFLPEWSKDISEELIRNANLKGSPGFDPGEVQAKQVEQMTALGCSEFDIAATLRIEPRLLKKYYQYELETASTRINERVAKVALQSALGGNNDMVKFWLRTRAGWKETKEVQMTGANGGPIQFQEVKSKFLDAIEAEITDVDYLETDEE